MTDFPASSLNQHVVDPPCFVHVEARLARFGVIGSVEPAVAIDLLDQILHPQHHVPLALP